MRRMLPKACVPTARGRPSVLLLGEDPQLLRALLVAKMLNNGSILMRKRLVYLESRAEKTGVLRISRRKDWYIELSTRSDFTITNDACYVQIRQESIENLDTPKGKGN